MVIPGRANGLRHPLILSGHSLDVLSDKIQDVLSVHAEDASCATASSVEAERGYSGYDAAGTQEVWPAGVAEARAARRGVVRQQQREIPRETRIDLDKVRGSAHADQVVFDEHGIDSLQAVAHGTKTRNLMVPPGGRLSMGKLARCE